MGRMFMQSWCSSASEPERKALCKTQGINAIKWKMLERTAQVLHREMKTFKVLFWTAAVYRNIVASIQISQLKQNISLISNKLSQKS